MDLGNRANYVGESSQPKHPVYMELVREIHVLDCLCCQQSYLYDFLMCYSANKGKLCLDEFISDAGQRQHRFDENIYEDLTLKSTNVGGSFQFNSDFRKLQFDPTFTKKRETMRDGGFQHKRPETRKGSVSAASSAAVTPMSNMFASFEASKAKRRNIRKEIQNDRRKELESLRRDDIKQIRMRRRAQDATLFM